MKIHVRNKTCRDCNSDRLHSVLNLGEQPLANSFITEEKIKDEPFVPLEVFWCEDCNLAQLLDVVDKDVLYRDYVYFSSGMPTLSDHFLNYADDVIDRYLEPGDFVVELASNDGILLKHFKEKGYKVLGIDPAENIAKVANERGIPTLPEFFSKEIAEKVVAEHGKAKAILANNVVAHINDHQDLATGIAELIDDKGVFVFEAPYLVDMFENLSFDTIYHEHLSFLAVAPIKKLMESHGLEVVNVEVHPVQGQSLRVFVGKKGAHEVSPNVAKWLDRENELGFDKIESFHDLAKRVESGKNKVMEMIKKLKEEGKTIAGYGAPAKGNTLLNYYGIGPEHLDYILEDLPSKQNLLAPGTHIPVKNRLYKEANEPDVFLLLAWNYEKPILAKEQEFLSNGGAFLVPIGDKIRLITKDNQ